MAIVHGATAPTFTTPHATFTGLAAPSRGAEETCVWRTTIAPGAPGHEHSLDREEVLYVLSGAAVATLGGTEHRIAAGDALIVPARTSLMLANPHDAPLELVAVLPVGGRAIVPGDGPFVPPWAR